MVILNFREPRSAPQQLRSRHGQGRIPRCRCYPREQRGCDWRQLLATAAV